MRNKRQTTLGGALVALIPTLAVFVTIENPSSFDRFATWVLTAFIVLIGLALLGTSQVIAGWKNYRARRKGWMRALEAPKIHADMSAHVPNSASFRLVIPPGSDADHHPPYLATIKRAEVAIESALVSLEGKRTALHINWPDSFNVNESKLKRGRYRLIWCDQGAFEHEMEFRVSRHGFFRPKLRQHIPRLYRQVMSLGEDLSDLGG